MAIGDRISRKAKPYRRFYAFVDSIVEADPERPRQRLSLQLDAIDADRFDGTSDFTSDEGFALLRVQTTEKRLNSLGLGLPKEGEWLQVQIDKRAATPRAWVFPAERGFAPERIQNAIELTRLADDTGQGAIKRLKSYCSRPDANRMKAEDLLSRLNFANRENLKITALDVGQAACVAFSDGNNDFGYFDVGKPLTFNRRSFRKDFQHRYAKRGFVLLSHWDFDHYALAVNNPALLALDWYAPDQEVGPYTAKFQKQLGAKLNFIDGDVQGTHYYLKRCLGTDPLDRNATGYVFRFEKSGEAVLLPGDADYTFIPPSMATNTTTLMMPHHEGVPAQRVFLESARRLRAGIARMLMQ